MKKLIFSIIITLLKIAIRPGQVSYQDLFVSGRENVNQYRILFLITTVKGTLIAVRDARVDKPGDAPNNSTLIDSESHGSIPDYYFKNKSLPIFSNPAGSQKRKNLVI